MMRYNDADSDKTTPPPSTDHCTWDDEYKEITIEFMSELTKTAKKYGKTVLVDAMSSFGAYEINMAELDIDALVSSANKCLEGLPGLAFVIAKKSLIEGSLGNSPSHCLDLYDQYKGLYSF